MDTDICPTYIPGISLHWSGLSSESCWSIKGIKSSAFELQECSIQVFIYLITSFLLDKLHLLPTYLCCLIPTAYKG